MVNNDLSPDDFDKLLDDFIASQLKETEDVLFEAQEKKQKPAKNNTVEEKKEEPKKEKNDSYYEYMDDFSNDEHLLAEEERRLYNAITNLIKSSIDCAKEKKEKIDFFDFNIKDLIPRFSPQRTENLSKNIFAAWSLLLKSMPEELSKLPPNVSDEQILNFAEQTNDKNLMLALISYVETLIEIDSCEIAYNLRKVRYKKLKIEKKIYEEEKRKKEKIRLYINAIKEKNFPIDAETLVNNYFKTFRKDPDGANKILENNPATFAPIQIDKIPDRFFGMIKAKPEDGKKINKKLGNFLKNLKI